MSSKKGGVHFIKTTVIGGLLFMVPVVVLILVLNEARGLMLMVADPMADWFPVESVGGVALANIIAAVTLVLVCFIAGLVARSSFLTKIIEGIENKVLNKLPGYVLIKGMFSGLQDDDTHRLYPVLAAVANTGRVGLEIERMTDGRVVVLIPSSPNPWSGEVHIMTAHGPDLFASTQRVTRYMVEWVGREIGLGPSDAYIVCSIVADLHISEVVDAPNWLVSMHLPLGIFGH